MSEKISSQATVESYVNEAKQLKQEGKLDESINKYLAALKLNPDFISALNQLAVIYEEQREFDKAITYFHKVIHLQKNKDDSQAYAKAEIRLALVYLKQGKTEDAITIYQSAIDKDSQLPIWVYNQLGNALDQNDRVDEAITIYQKAIQLYPDDFNLYLRVAPLYTQTGNLESAIESYKQAIQLKSDLSFSVYANLANILRQQGQEQEAASWLNSSKEGQEGEIYLKIWNALNQTSLETLENESSQYPTDINQQLVEQYFKLTSHYKIIKLTSLSDEDKQFLERKNIPLAHLKLIQQSNHDTKQQEIYLKHFGYDIELHSKTGKELEKYPFYPFINSMLETGYIYTTCPISGNILRSNQSFIVFSKYVGVFYRFVGDEVFYLLAGGISGGKFQLVAVYLPRIDLIVDLVVDNRDVHVGPAINNFKKWMVSHWEIAKNSISRNVEKKQILNAVEFHFNLTHNLVNDLPGISLLHKMGLLNKVDHFFVGDYEFFGQLEDLYPEISKDKVIRLGNYENPNEKISEIVLKNDYFPLSIRSNFLPEYLVENIYKVSLQKCSTSFLSKVDEANKSFPLIWIGIRTRRRIWISQVEGIASLVNKLYDDFPNIGLVFDGFSLADSQVNNSRVLGENRAIIEEMKEVVNGIINLIDYKDINIYDTVGCMMHESIVWANAVNFHISSMGATGMTKVCLLANKIGIVHSNNAQLKFINWFGKSHRDDAVNQVCVPCHDIEDNKIKPREYSYECDWKLIYREAVKIMQKLSDTPN